VIDVELVRACAGVSEQPDTAPLASVSAANEQKSDDAAEGAPLS
jgi:hypothetical protein